jgi:alpha-L-arabinofuranosidase
MTDMPAYVQDVLDLIEYANGPATSKWGAKRAAAGHPAPFGLEYLGVGNEDKITDGFEARFKMIFDAVKTKHPEITVIGTVGPSPDGEDFDRGWKFASEQHVPIVDEHYYQRPQWFWDNLGRYDAYDRSKSHVYVGEYAAHDDKRRNTLRSALAEAAYLTSLERNADVVPFASYAPLLARRGHTQWSPDMIYFTGTEIFPTINYYVQQLFSMNSGDSWLTTTVSPPAGAAHFAASSVRDSKTGDLILKFVNGDDSARPLRVDLVGAKNLAPTAMKTVLAAPDANTTDAQAVLPKSSPITVGSVFDDEAPANSLTVIRIKTR